MGVAFLKMTGAGNDFVIVPVDRAPFDPDPPRARAIADRASGVGCDQLISIVRSTRAHAGMRIWNADGGEVKACGNAARCVGWLLMKAMDLDSVRIDTAAGILRATLADDGRVTIDMGPPRLGWRDIPLACGMDTREVRLLIDAQLTSPGCVNMGNPHVVFFVPDAESAPVNQAGPLVERHWLFPERVNVGFAQVEARDRIRLKVWERGVGQTAACGTGACAALVAAHRRGLCDREAVLAMDGGELFVQWRASDDHVLLTGPVAVEFSGLLPHLEVPT